MVAMLSQMTVLESESKIIVHLLLNLPIQSSTLRTVVKAAANTLFDDFFVYIASFSVNAVVVLISYIVDCNSNDKLEAVSIVQA